MASLKKGEWSHYLGCHVNGRENDHVTEVVNGGRMVVFNGGLVEGAWSCYRGQYNGG